MSGSSRAAVHAVPELPGDADGPVYREPWEAQAFAITVTLHERGLFSWPEWTQALAAQIERARAAGDEDTGDGSSRHGLAALERLLADRGVLDPGMLDRYADAWGRAAERTPHGQAIELRDEDFDGDAAPARQDAARFSHEQRLGAVATSVEGAASGDGDGDAPNRAQVAAPMACCAAWIRT